MDMLLWGYAVDPQFERHEAVRLSRVALSIDNSDPETLASAALISAFLVGDRDGEIPFFTPDQHWVARRRDVLQFSQRILDRAFNG